MEDIIVMPWSSDSEWQSIRQDIFGSKELRNYKRALRKLLLWKTRGRQLSRGLYCTELILQVISKDSYFCDVDDIIIVNDLVRLYSMAIMKFVNLTADFLGKGPQKSMYFRASRLELPSWLIDMRHKISHDRDLPTLKSLRTAMEFALDWLKTKYWNVDDNFLIVGPKLEINDVDVFMDTIEFYMLNKRQNNTSLKEDHLNALRKKLHMPEFSYKECLKKIKEYLANKHTSSQLVNLFITRYLLQSEECNISKGRISKADKALWSVMLKILTNSGLLTNVLQCLVTQNSRVAALWVIELCIVAYKTSRKINIKHNQSDDCLNCKPSHLDTSLVLRTALNTPHKHTIIFLKWLLRIQSNSLKVKQQYNLIKLISLYTGSVKVNPKNAECLFTVDDLIKNTKNENQSQWSLAFGQLNWRQVPFGSAL